MSLASSEIDVGFSLPVYTSEVDAGRQRGYHQPAEVSGGLFGDNVDLSILANDCILAAYPIRDGRTTNLHMSQRMVQTAPVHLGERLTVEGVIGEVQPMLKGTRVRFDFTFFKADGSAPVRAEMTSMRVDRETMRKAGAGSAKKFEIAGYEAVGDKHPTPARVTGYSHEFPLDQVHFDPVAAAAIGLRAPVAQGLMSLTWMMEVLAGKGVPSKLDITVEFRRPIFWDDEISILARDETDFQVRNAAGEVCSVGRVAHLRRD